jgi:hypothetical protein
MQKANFITYSSKEELEKARVLEAAQSSYTERFYILMKLIKVSAMISKAKIIHSPQLPKS